MNENLVLIDNFKNSAESPLQTICNASHLFMNFLMTDEDYNSITDAKRQL
jgi:hypothetical protein